MNKTLEQLKNWTADSMIVSNLPQTDNGWRKGGYSLESELTSEEKQEFLTENTPLNLPEVFRLLAKYTEDYDKLPQTQFGRPTVNGVKRWLKENDTTGQIEYNQYREVFEIKHSVSSPRYKPYLSKDFFSRYGAAKTKEDFINSEFHGYLRNLEALEKHGYRHNNADSQTAEDFCAELRHNSLCSYLLNGLGVSVNETVGKYSESVATANIKGTDMKYNLTSDDIQMLRRKEADIRGYIISLALEDEEVKTLLKKIQGE